MMIDSKDVDDKYDEEMIMRMVIIPALLTSLESGNHYAKIKEGQ